MGWEQRGNNRYFYRKEREGSRVRSVYVGKGEIAHMIAQLQSSSPLLERFARSMKAPDEVKFEKAEAALEQARDLIQLTTQAALLTAGYHTHKRQWRRKRNVGSC
jgi:hypothetical protein